MNKKIVFLLPAGSLRPIGGYKVVFEYVNRLEADGCNVNIIYPSYCFKFNQNHVVVFLRQCKALLRFFYWGIKRKYSSRSWFSLDSRVKECWVWSLASRLPEADAYVATAVQTSVYLQRHREIPDRKKYYLIQHFEDWVGATVQDVLNTYHFPLHKIVIASWLEKIVYEVGEECVLIHNGFDFTYFKKIVNITLRNRFTICMLYHLSDWKGCSDGFHALDIVKAKYPDLQVNIFGVPSRPKELPDWYHYYQQPDRETHNRLYNESAIFIGTSWAEGWGLTVGEAMICGCAVACTDNAGYLEMATDCETALVSPVKDVEALANNIIRLIEDDDLRCRIAEAGNRNIQRFTWERAYAKMKYVLNI